MAEKRNNYCQLLGLNPLKENSYSVESILKKIETKKGKWANESRNKQNDTDQRFKAERLVNATADMERIMKDSILRHKEFTDAVQELKGKSQRIRQDCVILTDGTSCSPVSPIRSQRSSTGKGSARRISSNSQV